LLNGHWPTRKLVAVEKGAESNFNIPQGQQVYLRLNDHEYAVQVGGLVYNAFLQPPGFGGKAQFYASRDNFTNLTGEQDFNQILAAAPIYNEAAVKDLADRMQRQLEKLDVESSGAAPVDGDRRVMDPNKHFLQNSLDAIFLILGVMGGLVLILGLLLVYNTITAIVGQQVTQIGVMKAIGAGTGQILLIYFSGVLIYGVLALLVAIPLSVLGAQQLSNFLLYFFNVGDWVTFDFGSHGEVKWQVVGLIFDPIITTSANVPRQVLLRAMDSVNKAATVWIQTERTDAAGEAEIAKGLRAYFDLHELKLNPQGTFAGQDTASAVTARILSNYGIIVKMLAAMAVIIALVGSIALSGVLSLNVRERTREIGVMRAIGASSWAIARLFIGEGLILGWLSWLIALPLSVPAGYLMVQALGAALNNEIVFHYTPAGALYWLGIITVLAIAASWLPAQGATRVSVRESLAYQ
jgi:ABC-type antimicrobial peptide transport system permease subunit